MLSWSIMLARISSTLEFAFSQILLEFVLSTLTSRIFKLYR